MKCTAVPKRGRLCEHTVAQILPPVEGGPPYFEVTDLRQDERFRNLPFVTSGPCFRYYCGVPLRTTKGINIGSIFVLDDKVREPGSLAHRRVLSSIAENCMSHLVMLQEKRGRERALKMNMCLAAFVDPEQQASKRRKDHLRAGSQDQLNTLSRKSSKQGQGRGSRTTPKETQSQTKSGSSRSRRSDRQHHDGDDTASDSDAGRAGSRVGENDQLTTYQRAADLMKDSLSLEGGGGVVFMAPSSAYQLSPYSDESSGEELPQTRASEGRRNSAGHATIKSSSSWGVRAQRKSISAENTASEPAEVLAKSLSTSNVDVASTAEAAALFLPLATSDINKLVKRHPRGKLFSFDADGSFGSSSSSEDKGKSQNYLIPRSKRTRASKTEAALLHKHFPGARQIIFLPLWDPTTSRWCACFSFNTCEYRFLQKEPDFLHSVAFGNCVVTEISRLATMTADRQKSDFIGSVSHELRSPLHGILASCEFLSETECDSFQKSLVDTADACARTLLDTLNMVLDYSKINHFERNLSKARRSRGDASTSLIAGQTPGLAPLLNIYGDVDLAIITEEVVEGVASGQMFRDSLNTVDTADLPPTSPLQIRRRGSAPSPQKAAVEVILDIAARDWTFVTQPGAFRRIVMNLFGNALKYTKRGFIRVKLETKDTSQTPDIEGHRMSNAASIVLTITDSGSGMSPEFMRTKLFTPFSQESSLNPGTGLGLSLVKSIVTMLNGDINFQSAQNVGTEVRVTLPMLKGSPSGSVTTSTPSSSGSSIERAKDDSLALVQKQSRGRTISVFHQPMEEQTYGEKHAAQMLSSTISHYLREWFSFTFTEWTPDVPTDIVITAENDLPALILKDPSLVSGESRSTILVLCTTASRQASRHTIEGVNNAETLCHPFGPYKLAKSLRACLQRLGHEGPPLKPPTSSGTDQGLEPVDEVADAVAHVTLGHPDTETPGMSVIQQGSTLGSEDSLNAQMALDSLPSKSSSSDNAEAKNEFPFPTPDPKGDGTVSPPLAPLAPSNTRPPLAERRTISATIPEIAALESGHISTAMSSLGALTDNPVQRPAVPSTSPRMPRLLLVDDNRVNLRLLDTFMRKRSYTSVSLAEDGSQAVAAFTAMISEDPPSPPDIVFMDLSMPIMDGFEATRRIREVEAEVRGRLDPMETPASALIIALTGLASGRDQSEAFTSGFDLYLTKPVSMREVGRLLSNWEANGGTTTDVPHGPVTGAGAEAS